jgi:hypothetical protein
MLILRQQLNLNLIHNQKEHSMTNEKSAQAPVKNSDSPRATTIHIDESGRADECGLQLLFPGFPREENRPILPDTVIGNLPPIA